MNKKPFLYKVGSFLLSPIYKLYYNPKITGASNLNISGSKVIASNHIHLYDQCNTIISTKEFITFLAKKEYFDSPLTRWFFSSVGCISVDRTKKDHTATEKALAVLDEKSSIGLFPEGTRNALKEDRIKFLYNEYEINANYKKFKKNMKKVKASQIDKMINLLNNKEISSDEFKNNIHEPDKYLKDLVRKKIISSDEYYDTLLLEFKFGAVSLAKKENAYLIPVAITGNYKFRSKDLHVRIGSPLKITEMDLEEANQLLRDKIIELIKLNLE